MEEIWLESVSNIFLRALVINSFITLEVRDITFVKIFQNFAINNDDIVGLIGKADHRVLIFLCRSNDIYTVLLIFKSFSMYHFILSQYNYLFFVSTHNTII